MTVVLRDPRVTLHGGDCLDVLPTLDAASIDAIVTDPPYGIGFMGHTWDQPGAFGPLRAGAGHSPGHPRERADRPRWVCRCGQTNDEQRFGCVRCGRLR